MELSTYKDVLKKLGAIICNSEFSGHVYSVGGCERDRILRTEIKDIDLVVDIENGGIRLSKWLFKQGVLLRAPVIYENYGTAMFCLKSAPDVELEAVQTRKESYRDMTTRNPETAYGSIQEDCKRRDFTVNALYRNIETDELLDLTGRSIMDMHQKIIRSCDDPDIIFKEDPLRILRAVRFACKLKWIIDDDTYEGMVKNVYRLNIVSQERITDEFNKILCQDAYQGLGLIHSIGAMKYICSYFEEIDEEKYLDILKTITWTTPEPLCRLAIILMKVSDPEAAMREMKYSLDDIKEVMTIIREVPVIQGLGEYYYSIKPAEVRKVQYRLHDKKLFLHVVQVAHALNNRGFDTSKRNMQAMHVLALNIKMQRDSQDFFNYVLPVDGNDVMKIKNISPSPLVKEYLSYLMDVAYEKPGITREKCINILKTTDL